MPEIDKSKKSRRSIFISHACSDGKNFADNLRHRLIDFATLPRWMRNTHFFDFK